MLTEDISSKAASADIDIIVLSDSGEEDDDAATSDNGSSIQPIRQNKRPVSAISSDSSSLDLNSVSSSANASVSSHQPNGQFNSNSKNLFTSVPPPPSLFNSTSKCAAVKHGLSATRFCHVCI